jgi:hypothetical protein
MMSVAVIWWWSCLCGVAAFNLLAWSLSAVSLRRDRLLVSGDIYRMRRLQLMLSAVYVLGCAYRSAFPVYDVPRLCLIDHGVSSVIVGRSVATLAELCFVGQWALMLHAVSRAARSSLGTVASLALVPLIAIAETCSWYSVLTTSNIGHVAEESIWGLSVVLLVASVVTIWPRCAANRRPLLAAWCTAGLIYVAFMFSIDVPMYWSRWIADEAVGRHYMSIVQGLHDVSARRVVSYRWEDWRSEVVWMSLYFSVAVWVSISLIHTPSAKAQLTVREPKRLPSVGLRLTD